MIIITYSVLIKKDIFTAYKITVGKSCLYMKTLMSIYFLSLFIFGSVTSDFSFILTIVFHVCLSHAGVSYVACCGEELNDSKLSWFNIKISLYIKSNVLVNLTKYWLFNTFK